MALKKKPVTGMKDMLPAEMELRAYVMDVIRETYGQFGFCQIETPCVEHLDNLNSKQGGENEKLIFKILKRGEKLKLDEAREENDLTDCGLRYDLTVPLVRYYANHAGELPSPFKALQMGNVWRADRPQRGRYRQFMQCDIDILGEAGILAEIELILAATTALGRLGFSGFQIRINDRRILKAMAAGCGFSPEEFDSVFITLDKLDKIGAGGVAQELTDKGFAPEPVSRYRTLLEELAQAGDPLPFLEGRLGAHLPAAVLRELRDIIDSVEAGREADFAVVFDPSLVRGMSYYTGPIFEVAMPEFGGSCGGGGRYDGMIGKFTGNDVPACGISIGFERIILLLTERGFQVPGQTAREAYLVEKGISGERLREIFALAQEARKEGRTVLVAGMNKNKKFQKEQLTAAGYGSFREFYQNPLQ